ncbi:pimeloyl-ACP methyl ester esterase BioH [Thiosulfativibrio zosterae]|uniref:Pimeloyl-[acyl-carrier protein] methyl ester esterase n=1 Tax=Thiosulfativibrio zosterae TaxID=2675053 RepID=A0A6F8PK23_9GAMM|nr:pimeloyl-ACP methyl ester esterase BioH [Thiosulfativibrio zosterae]BBP42453.1 pimeloyl-[acyl-carrier protein] methyl ester esterase [Thiosulfativibrio zosterae]
MPTSHALYHQMLPSTQPHAEHLTLVHGWAAESAGWADWAQEFLTPHFQVHLIDLPGFGQSPELSKTQIANDLNGAWCDALAQALPPKSHLLGWSLGGLLCQQLAWQYPRQVQSLICLASTPRFTQQDGWPNAVSPELMANFMKALGVESLTLLKQFWNLQLQGSDNARPLMKQLSAQMRNRNLPSLAGLTQGLKLLRDLDNRPHLQDITQPTLWLFGEHDPLIPQALQTQLHDLQPSAQLHIIKGASHMPFFSHPQDTADALIHFIHAQIET